MKRQRDIPDRSEIVPRPKDGRDVRAVAWANPVYDRHGGYAGALVLVGDLSMKEETQRKLRSQVGQ